jgi:hypothetical protein
MAIVYGPDDFTVESNINLTSYDADWVESPYAPSGNLRILATGDAVTQQSTNQDSIYYWTGTGYPTARPQIVGMRVFIKDPSTATDHTQGGAALCVQTGTGRCYLVVLNNPGWDEAYIDGEFTLYEVASSWTVNDQADPGLDGAGETVTLRASVDGSGNFSCTLDEYPVVELTDTDTTYNGPAGIHMWRDSGTAESDIYHDDIWIGTAITDDGFAATPVSGSGSAALAVPALTGTGTQTQSGTGSMAVDVPTLAATGTETTRFATMSDSFPWTEGDVRSGVTLTITLTGDTWLPA